MTLALVTRRESCKLILHHVAIVLVRILQRCALLVVPVRAALHERGNVVTELVTVYTVPTPIYE
jgi:hypothetical protein